MNKKITIVTNEDDWEGLYIDGKIAVQDHKLRVEDVLDALGICAESVTCDYDWLFDQGYLPSDLKDVVVQDD
jgi:hypothetical protein